MRSAMLVALCLAVAAIMQALAPEAQVAPVPDTPVVAESVETADVAATFAPTQSVVRDSVEADTVATEPPVEDEVVEREPVPAPLEVALPPAPAFTSDIGLVVDLPAGWAGPSSASEADLPAYVHYTFTNTASGSALAGVTLSVERVVGLNALDQERWTRGLTPYGYHGLRPVGPASVPLAGLGIELAGEGMAGAVAFVQRGQTFWAVHVQAPEAVWAARQADVLALFEAVQLP